MKTFALLAILLVSCMAVTMKRPMTNAQMQQYQEIQKQNKWASIMLNLAELHVQAKGPFDELVDAIEAVIDDLDNKLERAEAEYQRRTDEHNAEVARIQGLINSANEDIAYTTEFIENTLLVQQANLEQDIANLEEAITTTQQYIVDQGVLRENQKVKFAQTIDEHNEALAAIAEANEVLGQLSDGVSLVQVNKAKKTLEKLQNKISNTAEGSLVKALLTLTTEEFADSSKLQKVFDLLEKVQYNLQESVAKFTLEEQQAQQAYDQDIANKNVELNNFKLDLVQKQEQLAATIQSIEDNRDFLEQRKRDLAEAQQELVDENANFDRITEIYNDLVAQLEDELAACSHAVSFLNSSDIASYIGDRTQQDVVLNQPHGSGITVERNPSDFE